MTSPEAPAEILRLGVAQMNSTPDVPANLAAIERLALRAVDRGCHALALPENAAMLCDEKEKLGRLETLDGPQVSFVRELAARTGLDIVLGSFAEKAADGRAHNTLVHVGASGSVRSTYRKIHLFDVNVAEDTAFRESDSTAPGPPTPVTTDLRGWVTGLTICYDLRFPELYRALSSAGAELLLVPSAFTLRTGLAHWHVLLRARAIENLCWVAAPAQVGRPYGRRESFGHAVGISPWGTVVADAGGAGEQLVVCELDRAEVESRRRSIPALTHRRL